MERREYQLVEGSSKKFWAIELEGTSHAVSFGRIGTAGQTQTKGFDTADAARKSYEKLIAEKVKKGYVETSAAAPATPTPAPPAASTAAEPAAPVGRTIDLEPDPGIVPLGRRPGAAPRPPAPPFDLAGCLARLRKVSVSRWGWEWDWSRAGLSGPMTREEAQFWFAAMTALEHREIADLPSDERSRSLPGRVADRLAGFEPQAAFTFADAKAALQRTPQILNHAVVIPLANLFTPDDLLDFIRETFVASKGASHGGDWNESVRAVLVDGFCRYVAPDLDDPALAALKDRIRPAVTAANWPADYYRRPPVEFFLAALLGMADELAPVLAALPDDHYQKAGWDHSHYHQTQRVVFGLGDPARVEAEMRRLKLPIRDPGLMRAWLAVTRLAALDYARDNILAEGRKEECERLMEVFACVEAPEAAPFVLELKLSSKAPAAARRWLDEQVGHAVAGLVPVAAGRGKLAEAAVEYLRGAKKKGHEAAVRAAVEAAPPEAAEAVRRGVLDYAEAEYPPLDPASAPAGLAAALDAAAKAKPGKSPPWAAAAVLPPVLVGGRRLTDDHAGLVLAALRRGTLSAPDPLVAALKAHADAASLDAFAWKLFQLWQGEGSPSKEKWAMAAVGLLGGDGSALRLTPLIRNWPGESQHQRAVFGLECLRAIGSDTALMQLNGVAQKLKFKGLKQKAAEAMEAIAAGKGLTREQLEDRVVPDCDLDERGRREFDFGPRQFRFVLGPGMRPMVKDADGKAKPDLPKPGAKDDPAKAAAAVAAWKLMKKQVKEVAATQAQRLEQAMVTGRRWPLADFLTLLVRHPLMTHLVRLLLWGGYDAGGKLAATFRVTEDQAFADADDNEYAAEGIDAVGLVHPLHLTADQSAAWGGVFGDYEIVPPFPQLGRGTHRLEPDEARAAELTRFAGVKVPAPTLVFGLEKLGWVRGTGMDGGGFDEHSKPYPGSGVTAVVHYDGNVGFGYIDPNETLALGACYFVPGHRGPSGYAHYHEKAMPLGDVDPVAVSEVLGDLAALAAKGA